MGKVIVFPGTYERTAQSSIEATPELTLTQKAEYFLHLRQRQQMADQSLTVFEPSPAQRKMNRLAAEMLDVRIDRAVQNLTQPPADCFEARANMQTLFALADSRPDATDVLEEAALYVTSAYWNAGFVATDEVAPLLRSRAAAAEQRHCDTNGVPLAVDAIHAVVTDYVVGCHTDERLQRLQQIEQHNLLQYFDHPHDDPGFPPVA